MRTVHWNGEHWYVNERSAWKRVRQWVIWIGGWEKANGKGWHFRTMSGRWWMGPTPVSLFGHRFTYFGWGWQMRWSDGYLTYTGRGRKLYWSLAGTPRRATTWIWGWPKVLDRAATERSAVFEQDF